VSAPGPPRTTTDADPGELLELARGLATEAGELLYDAVGQLDLGIVTKTTATDLVTDLDRAVERLLVDGLLAVRPDDGVLGEEGSDRAGTSGVRWIIDPVDGTTNFVYGYPGFNVSVAAEVDGQIVAGCVVDPLHRDVFCATLGGGATRNDLAISCRDTTDLSTALVGTGFSYDPERRRRQAVVLTHVLPEVRDIRRQGAAAVDLCWVACGRLDAFYERGLQPWDHAAGGLIATEAGARVEDLDGNPTSFEFTIAAPPQLFEPLRQLVERAGARGA
jgi:fructose-1,6-bisphosphatase/inositol monophosphatase family enzyme